MTAKRKKIVRTPYASEIVFLDPLECGSTIGYQIQKGDCVEGSVDLSDCSRKIMWYFYKNTPIEKIDRAIAVLTNFRNELTKARSKRWQ